MDLGSNSFDADALSGAADDVTYEDDWPLFTGFAVEGAEDPVLSAITPSKVALTTLPVPDWALLLLLLDLDSDLILPSIAPPAEEYDDPRATLLLVALMLLKVAVLPS